MATSSPTPDMTPQDMAFLLARAADAKQARDLRIFHVTDITELADYFVIATGTSSTHLKTLSDEMERVMKLQGVLPHHVEGYLSGNWVLLDFGCAIAHLFTEEARSFYSLERLWSDARVVPLPEETPKG